MFKTNTKKIIIFLLGILAIHLQVFAIDINKNPAIKTYIDEISQEYKLNSTLLEQWFNTANFNPTVIEKMNTPYEALPWHRYQELYVSQERVKNGVLFWKKNQATLARAEKIYGVPPEVIVAIIGIESRYGKHMGNFNVFNSLLTLAFDYPKRANFFKKELTQFILLCHEQQWNPLTIDGSYAGAIGIAQFMPSSYRHYAIDFTNNGHKDLLHNEADAIGSVANYLKTHHWQAGQPIAIAANVTGSHYEKLDNKADKLKFTIAQLENYGISPIKHINPDTKATLYQFEGAANKPVYWLGLANFHVIMRYNTSSKYALAVVELADKINQAYTQ